MIKTKKSKNHKKTIVNMIRNKSRISRINTFIRRMILSIKNGNYQASVENLRIAQSEMNRGVKRGLLQKKVVSRRISHFNSMVKSMTIKDPEDPLRIS